MADAMEVGVEVQEQVQAQPQVETSAVTTTTVAAAPQTVQAPVKEARKVAFELLSYMKSSQLQNGLRHADYDRYRQYCTRRAHRLRVVLKLTTSRTVAKPKSIASSSAKSDLPLILLFTLCERAWAQAMHLKAQVTQDTPRKRIHQLKRLSKASKWAHALQQLCAQRADIRTQLQVEAYAHTLNATLAFEREQHEEALRLFLRAKTVYDKLGEVGSADLRSLCEERAVDLDDSIRFCKYMLRTQDLDYSDEARSMHSAAPEEQFAATVVHATTVELEARLHALAAERLERNAALHDVVTWLDRSIAVNNPKVRTLVASAKSYEAKVDAAWHTNTTEARAALPALYQRIVNAFADALKLVRDDLAEVKLDAHRQNMLQLQFYCHHEKLRAAIARKMLVAEALRLKLAAQSRKEDLGGRKKSKPHELVLAFENITQLLTELHELAVAAKAPGLAQDVHHRLAVIKVFRTSSIADSHMRFHKHAEASALYRHAQEAASQVAALASTVKSVLVLPPLFTAVQARELVASAAAGIVSAQAAALLDANEEVSKVLGDVHKLSVKEERKVPAARSVGVATPAPARAPAPAPAPVVKKEPAPLSEPKGPLLSRIDAFEPITVANPHWHIVNLAPPLEPVGCKPILFDLAFNAVKYPDLSSSTSTSTSTSTSAPSASAASPSSAGGLFGLGKFFGR